MSSPVQGEENNSRPTAELRAALAEKLHEEGADDLAEKLEGCAERISLICTNCGSEKKVETRCKQRWCPVCAVILSIKRIQRYDKAAKAMQWPLMLTLTMKNTAIAEAAANEIVKAFTRLRRTQFWRNTVKGGVASYECTNQSRGWHPHLHVLVDCRWLAVNTAEPRRTDSRETRAHKLRSAQRELSQQWAQAIGQTQAIVHARRAYGPMLKEALKYNLKPSDLLNSKAPIAGLLRALKGKRLVIPFGTCYGLGKQWKTEDAERAHKCACPDCKEESSFVPSWTADTMRREPHSRHHGTTHTTDNATLHPIDEATGNGALKLPVA